MREKRRAEDGAAPEGPAGRAVLLPTPIPTLTTAQTGRPLRAHSLGQTATPLKYACTFTAAGRPGAVGANLSPVAAIRALAGSPAAATGVPRRRARPSAGQRPRAPSGGAR